MSTAVRRSARACVIAALVALAPAASAGGRAAADRDAAPGAAAPSVLPLISREQARLATSSVLAAGAGAAEAGEREAVRLIALAEAEAIRRREEAKEDARVARAIEAQAARLRPGAFVWRPERATSGPVEIVASIAAQRLYVFRAGKLIGVSTASTGRSGHVTPTGSFPILEKRRQHFSNLYNNAPMPNMQRLTWDGVALHAGNIPGYAASHGCVRLPLEFSRLLFGVTSIGSNVHVVQGTPASPAGALAFAANRGGGAVQTARAR
ncbi:MAG TPA: L,D-transpeptidase family protein [Allosphingosinicella sp.]|jgi:lipoprotein-anchoring transpeptidase ErfK/SrfK